MLQQHLCSGYVATLSLTSYCSFALMLRHEFLVSSIFAVTAQFSCRDKTLLCSAYLFCHDLVCYVATTLLCFVLKSLSRHIKVCHDLVSLCLAYFYVATLRSMSRHILISPLKYIATLSSFVATRSVQQRSVICRDIDFLVVTELLLSVLSSVSTNSSMLQESMSQHSGFCHDIDSAF